MTEQEIGTIYAKIGEDAKIAKRKEYERRNRVASKGEILFCGSSLMENFPIGELQLSYPIRGKIYNRGIGGYVLSEFEENLDTLVFALEPRKLFLNIGTNDLNAPDFSLTLFLSNYERVLDKILARLPCLQLYLLAYYPVNLALAPFYFQNRSNERIQLANKAIQAMAERKGIRFIDINEPLMDDHGDLKTEYSIDGIHFYGDGYATLMPLLLPFLNE